MTNHQLSGTTFHLSAKGIQAQGMETPEGFVVRAGSGAVRTEVPSCADLLKRLRATLIGNGVLEPSNGSYTFVADYIFGSPSTAAGVVLGRSTNGRTEWKDANGRSLKERQE